VSEEEKNKAKTEDEEPLEDGVEEIDEDLEDPDLEGDIDDEFAAAASEDDEDEEEEEEATPAARKVATDDDDDDEEEEEDVEADLDAILKDRLASSDDADDEDEEPPVPSDPNSVPAKRAGEFVCGTCFMLVSAAAPKCPMGDGYELCAPIA
jgi:hypothetical protein